MEHTLLLRLSGEAASPAALFLVDNLTVHHRVRTRRPIHVCSSDYIIGACEESTWLFG